MAAKKIVKVLLEGSALDDLFETLQRDFGIHMVENPNDSEMLILSDKKLTEKELMQASAPQEEDSYYIQLDTVEPHNSELECYCAEHHIIADLINASGIAGVPVVEYTGTYKDLCNLLKRFWLSFFITHDISKRIKKVE